MQFVSKKENYRYFLLFLVLLVASLIICLLVLRYVASEQIRTAKEDFKAVSLAYEVSRSSENATKMLRLYVITGKAKFRESYDEILAIRNGTAARPEKNNQVYWDLVLEPNKPLPQSGSMESLKARILKHKFTIDELAILNNSQAKIQQLAHLELRIINAMEGKFEDAAGNFTIQGKPNPELAEKILFGDDYQRLQLDVMKPIQQFYQHVIKRTEDAEDAFDLKISKTINLAISLAALTSILLLISLFKVLNSLSRAKEQSEQLLLNILPRSIAYRLEHGEEQIADEYSQASILFADIVNFTKLSKELGAKKTVAFLNNLFAAFDKITEEYNVEKVKTIGDNYMAVAGVPERTTDHAKHLANFSLAMLEKLKEFNKTHTMNIELRIGMSSGPLVAGVIGQKKFVYDVWGNVVNLASRLESLSRINGILVSEKMASLLEDDFILELQKPIEVKGLGLQTSYFLLGKKT